MHSTTSLRVIAVALASCALLGAPAAAQVNTTIGNAPTASSNNEYDVANEYELGLNAIETSDYREAESHFRRVTNVSPSNADPYFLLGESHLQQGEYRRARNEFRRALNVDPDHIQTHQQLAVAHALLGDEDDALDELNFLRARRASCALHCEDAYIISASIWTLEEFFFGEIRKGRDPLDAYMEHLQATAPAAGDTGGGM